MPSTYTLNNGIELIATGEQSGTWGDTTNTNMSLLDTALDGQVTVTLASAGTSGSPNTLPISDGAVSDGRNRMVIFNDGADLGATAYVQLTPNDAEKIVYIRNALSGSRSIIVFQGTYNASNDYEIPAGATAVVYFNGGGTGAVAANVFNNAHFDALNIVGAAAVGTTLTVGTSLNIASSTTVDGVLDEDNMASDSATKLATQQSIKAYVDSQVTAQDLDFAGDSGTGAVDLDSQTFTISGTANEIETSASGQTLTVGLPDNVTIAGDLTVDTNTLFVDSSTNKVSIGTTSSDGTLHVHTGSAGVVTAAAAADDLVIENSNAAGLSLLFDDTSTNSYGVIYWGNETDGNADGRIEYFGSTYVTAADRQAMLFRSAAVERLRLQGTAVVVNETGADTDFRVESDTNTHALFVDAGNSRVGINESSPNAMLHVKTSGTDEMLRLEMVDDSNTAGPDIVMQRVSASPAANDPVGRIRAIGENSDGSGVTYGRMEFFIDDPTAGSESGLFSISTELAGANIQRLAFKPDEVVFNEPSQDSDFRVESDSNTHMLFVDAGNNVVGINETNPNAYGSFTVTGTGNLINANASSGTAQIRWFENGTGRFEMETLNGSNGINFKNSGGVVGGFASTGNLRVGVGNTFEPVMQYTNSGRVAGNPGFTFNDDLDTGMYNPGAQGSIAFSNNGTQTALLTATEVVFNDLSNDQDFRVESNGNTHMLFVDAGNNQVHVATSGVGPSNFNVLNNMAITNQAGAQYLLMGNQDSAGVNNPNVIVSGNGVLTFGNGDSWSSSTGGTFTETFRMGLTEVVANESSRDQDFRVESDSSAHMLFVDAGNNRVGIGLSTPGSLLQLSDPVFGGGSAKNTIGFGSAGWGNPAAADQALDGGVKLALFEGATQKIQIGMNSSAALWFNATGSGTTGFKFYSANTDAATPVERLHIGQTGDLVFNTTGVDADFRISSVNNGHMLFVDASTDSIGINTGSPGAKLDINGGDARVINTGGGVVAKSRVSTANQTDAIVSARTTDSNGTRTGFMANAYPDASYSATVSRDDTDFSAVGWQYYTLNSTYETQTHAILKMELTSGTEYELISATYAGTVFNEASADLDFRVESDTNAHALFLDAGNNELGLFTSNPQSQFHFVSADETSASAFRITYNSPTDDRYAEFRYSGIDVYATDIQNNSFNINMNGGNAAGGGGKIIFGTGTLAAGTTERLTIFQGGGIVANETGTNSDFRVESNNYSHALFVQGSNGRVSTGDATGAPPAQLYVSTNANLTEPMGINDSNASGATQKHRISFKYQTAEVGSIKSNNSATTFNTSSDARLKENIADAEDAGAKVDAIQVRQFDWKVDGSHQDYGMVAQELVEVAPEAVTGEPDGEEMMGVDYSKLVPMLIKEIQSLRERVAQLESN